MLTLKNIIKDYETGNSKVRALDGISLKFRESEFVSILGPSGCGKTTLLNIVGGLDQYTSGDLVINGLSTTRYKDKDWDTYRNHSIGFVFQSYNLIPHQTVLANVELALTLSGISKKERRARAIEALEQVGLGDQLKKKPNQMSGGQMQRVAIARALVNDPDILLADEPTGALDTQTSVQIMDILRKISEKKLIIMVTHNPDLAQEYSSRIIRLLDGRVVDDTNPYHADEQTAAETSAEETVVAAEETSDEQKPEKKKKGKKKSMSFFTALSLSLNNLLTKKTRTFMTSFAGSIGIIGIALILSVSSGVNNYIDSVQRDTLSTYPLTIQKETQDFSAMFSAMTEVQEKQQGEIDPNKIYVDDSMGAMMSAMSATTQNNLEKFKQHLDQNYDLIKDAVSDIQYTYSFDLQIFSADGKTQVSPTKIFDNMGDAFSGISEMMEISGGGMFNVMSEMINNQQLLDEQYELVGENSHWPTNAHEVVLVVNGNNQISKMTLYMLGVLDQSELEEIMTDLMMNGKYDSSMHMQPYDINEFIGMEFMMLNTSDFFYKTDKSYTVGENTYPIWNDMREDPLFAQEQDSFVKENGTKLVISGIVRPRSGTAATSITGALGYTKALTDEILQLNTESEVINQQKATPDVNVLTGLSFERIPYTRENIAELINKVDDATMEKFYDYMTKMILGNAEFSDQLVVKDHDSFLGFFALMPADYQARLLGTMLEAVKAQDPTGNSLIPIMTVLSQSSGLVVNESTFLKQLPILSQTELMLSLVGIPASEQMPFPINGLIELCGEQTMQSIYDGMTQEIKNLKINEEFFTILMQGDFITDENFVTLEEVLYNMAPQTDATYDSVMKELGASEKASPASINFYAKDFESKDRIEAFITEYNNSVEEIDRLKYTDIVGVMMSSVSTIINAISYVLIAFVAISLVVSSIMIGIITYISVLERTKEIGILRAIGASKKDVRRVFNAETLIVGFVAGLIGILATLGFNVLINIILYHFTEIENLKAVLPPEAAVILVVISMFLTFIAGLFPAGFAARRNPVEALRSE